jgi:hypothetical protein
VRAHSANFTQSKVVHPPKAHAPLVNTIFLRSHSHHAVFTISAETPCPPAPPPVYDMPECPRVTNVSVSGSRMYPSCLGGNCNAWGVVKLVDGREKSTSSLGHTSWATNPYMQLDLGSLRNDILQVRLVARADAALYQSNKVNVYISTTKDFRGVGSTLCDDDITFEYLGDDYIALCPVNFTARYVTVMKNGTNVVLSLQEVQPMVDGELCVGVEMTTSRRATPLGNSICLKLLHILRV